MELTGDYVAQMLANASGQPIESLSFADPDGSSKYTATTKPHYPGGTAMNINDNTEIDNEYNAEIVPMVYTARQHRKHARNLLFGRKGLTDAEKIARVEEARDSLDKALALMITGEITDTEPGF